MSHVCKVEVPADRVLLAARCWFAVPAPLHCAGPYHVITQWKIGGEGGWDYLARGCRRRIASTSRTVPGSR